MPNFGAKYETFWVYFTLNLFFVHGKQTSNVPVGNSGSIWCFSRSRIFSLSNLYLQCTYVLGYLYDVTGEWWYTFGLGGFFIALSGVMLLLVLPCCGKKGRRRRGEAEAEASEAGRGGEEEEEEAAAAALGSEMVVPEVSVPRSQPVDIVVDNGGSVTKV